MTGILKIFSLSVESPFHAFSIELLLTAGTILTLTGIFLLITAQTRSTMDMSPSTTVILAACMMLMMRYWLVRYPEFLKFLQAIIALTAVLIPALTTVVVVRGLVGGA